MKFVLPAALALAFAVPAVAAEPANPAADVQIPFANKGGIQDWRVDQDESVVYLRDSRNQWYRLELMRPAIGVRSVLNLGIDAGPTDTLDKFGAIVVRGQRYQFRSLERIAAPPKRGATAG